MIKRSTEEKQLLLNRYYAGEKLRDIASSEGINYYALKSNFHNWGAKMRPRGQVPARVNEHAFSSCDTQETAYWLGFLMADGHVPFAPRVGRQRVLQVNLARRDAGHLGKLRDFLAYKGKIHEHLTNQGHPASTLFVVSERLCQNLEALGCTPRKTLQLSPPIIAPELLRHWVRGFFDGDGYVYKASRTPTFRSYIAGFCGLPNVLEFIREWAVSVGLPSMTLKPYSRTRLVFRMAWSSHEAIARLAFAMYDGATVSLDRKRALFLEALG